VTQLLAVKSVHKSFGGVKTLTDFSFDLAGGEILGLIGPNGAGKTTVFNIISGIYRASSGSVFIDGVDIVNRHPARIARDGIARTFQVARTFNDMTVEENLRVALVRSRLSLATEQRQVGDMLDRIGLSGIRDTTVGVLPDGQKKLLEVARAMMVRPKVILFDEPFAGVSEDVISLMITLIRDLAAQGVGCLVISHDIASMPKLCREVVVLVEGKVMTRGTVADVRNDPRVVEAYLGADA